jgi:CYTH domain-containing protein
MLVNESHDQPLVLLCDRGALDTIAYTGKDVFLRLCEKLGFDPHALRERYKLVLHLVTTADGAEPFYTLENNSARSESPEEARALDRRTYDAWCGHQHHVIIDNSTGWEEKKRRALTALTRVLNMPDPLEKERKFRIRNWSPELIPEDAAEVAISQTYLTFGESGEERRLRVRMLDGTSSYYYTRKIDTDVPGVRKEFDDPIPYSRYMELFHERDLATNIIEKTRYCFAYAGHTIEIDVYHKPVDDLVIAEVEVSMSISLLHGIGSK